MAPPSMPPFIVGLMSSGNYSDFVLVCEGHKIEVHKAIVCPQSPVLATCIRSGFKETRENTVDVNFDLSVCQQMVHFLYTGDYEVPRAVETKASPQHPGPQPLSVDDGDDADDDGDGDGASQSAHANDNPLQDSSSTGQDPTSKDNFLESLRFHVQMNSIADYYEISALSECSRSKIHEHFKRNWSASDFTETVREAAESTGDKTLFKMAGSLAATHIEELGAMASFVGLALPNPMTAEIICLCGQRLQEAKKETTKLGNQLQAAEKHGTTLEASLKIAKKSQEHLESKLRAARKHGTTLEASLKTAETNQARLESDLQAVKKHGTTLEVSLKTAKTNQEHLESELLAAKNKIKFLENDLQTIMTHNTRLELDIQTAKGNNVTLSDLSAARMTNYYSNNEANVAVNDTKRHKKHY
ncbi:hypothetical protein F4775DRAFT_338970 [Biscogniauxia sp. FL1348]|nr:hypothetical protein F4775DRAFT_338970 [Biscogniauxia sp. FL1348]